jgi:hypothetical protein
VLFFLASAFWFIIAAVVAPGLITLKTPKLAKKIVVEPVHE